MLTLSMLRPHPWLGLLGKRGGAAIGHAGIKEIAPEIISKICEGRLGQEEKARVDDALVKLGIVSEGDVRLALDALWHLQRKA